MLQQELQGVQLAPTRSHCYLVKSSAHLQGLKMSWTGDANCFCGETEQHQSFWAQMEQPK
jgi:hypothetical protein